MSGTRLRAILTLLLLLIIIGLIAFFVMTRNLRNAPLTLGDGEDNQQTVTADDATTDAASDMIQLCEQLPGILTFNQRQGDVWDIMLLDETRTLTNLTDTEDNNDAAVFFPSWSLDGKFINFLSSRPDEAQLGPSQIELATGKVVHMDILQAVFQTVQKGLFDWDAAYSPDGEKLLWSSLRDLNLELYVIDTSADFEMGNATRLTESGARDWFASWSPDGRTIVFNNDSEGRENIYTVTVTDGTITALTDGDWDKMRAAWSLDGETILYVLDEDDLLPTGVFKHMLMNADGSDAHLLAENEIFSGGAVWSADGQYLVYMSNQNGRWQLFLRTIATDRDCLLVDSDAEMLFPVWRP